MAFSEMRGDTRLGSGQAMTALERPPRLIFLYGPPAAGKLTVARAIAERRDSACCTTMAGSHGEGVCRSHRGGT